MRSRTKETIDDDEEDGDQENPPPWLVGTDEVARPKHLDDRPSVTLPDSPGEEVTQKRTLLANVNCRDWEEISHGITIDSGAAETVIPEEMAKLYALMPTPASMAGLEYESATGEPIPNLGEKKIGLCLGDGSYRKMTMQVARGVTKPLGSVSRICAAGHTVVFDDEGSFILNKQSGVKIWRTQKNQFLV